MKKELLGQKKVASIFSNEGMDDVIKIIKSLEDFNALTYDVNETVKHGIKKQKGGFISAL